MVLWRSFGGACGPASRTHCFAPTQVAGGALEVGEAVSARAVWKTTFRARKNYRQRHRHFALGRPSPIACNLATDTPAIPAA